MPYSGPLSRPAFHIDPDDDEDDDDDNDDIPPDVPRSTPILLSNGKPLKSSLKSSSSTPHIPSPPPTTLHTRARSAPSSPLLSSPKNVHFPSNGLETIRLFSRSAKPAALSADDTETETDSESYLSRGFPFPRIPPRYTIDPSSSSQIPALDPLPFANVLLESLSLQSLALTGSLLVRNLAYEKSVAVRFTLDDWHTTSEVSAKYLHSATSWDRFTFSIRLDDYAQSLHKRTMWLVVRYIAPAVTELPGLPFRDSIPGEWWDNNAGNNYKVGFREENDSTVGTRRTVVSAPSSFPTPRPIPTPDSSRNSALAQTTMSRLRKLSLSNYAKPSSVNLFPDRKEDTTHVQGWDFQLADGASKKEESGLGTSFLASTSPPAPGPSKAASLHWPWGTSVTSEDPPSSATPSPPPPKLTLPLPKHEYSPRRSSPLASPKSSPPSTPPIPLPSPNSSAESIPDATPRPKAKRVFPPEIDITTRSSTNPDHNSPPPSPSPVPSLSPSSSSSSLDTDSGYQAFVKKWCFAGCPKGGYDLGQGAGVWVGGTPRVGGSPPVQSAELAGVHKTRRGGERIVGF